MIHSMINKIRQFKRSEKGNASVEFAIMVPILLVFMLAAVEIGIMTLRHAILERALDDTVRWVRLNTGATPTHAELKAMVCEYNVVPNCADNLTLEMAPRDIRNWEPMSATYACTDQSTTITPMSEYSFGMDNDLVVLRACAKYEPLFPGTVFASAMQLDADGNASLTTSTAFVQEPR